LNNYFGENLFKYFKLDNGSWVIRDDVASQDLEIRKKELIEDEILSSSNDLDFGKESRRDFFKLMELSHLGDEIITKLIIRHNSKFKIAKKKVTKSIITLTDFISLDKDWKIGKFFLPGGRRVSQVKLGDKASKVLVNLPFQTLPHLIGRFYDELPLQYYYCFSVKQKRAMRKFTNDFGTKILKQVVIY
jgi:hypothetical protein